MTMKNRKLLSGQCVTRLEKKLLRNIAGSPLRGRRKFKSIETAGSPLFSGLRIGDMYREPELEIKQSGDRFYRHSSDLHIGVDTTVPVFTQLLWRPSESILAKINRDLLICSIKKEVDRVWDEITRSPNPPVFNNWGYAVTVDIKTGKENG